MKLEQERKLWINAIGRLMLAFGGIEYSQKVILHFLGSRDLWERNKNKNFKDKANESIRVLEGWRERSHFAKEGISLINDALNLTEYRNLVAHNPLNFSIFKYENRGDQIRTVIQSLRDDSKMIQLGELTEVAEQSEYIDGSLYDISHRLWDMRE